MIWPTPSAGTTRHGGASDGYEPRRAKVGGLHWRPHAVLAHLHAGRAQRAIGRALRTDEHPLADGEIGTRARDRANDWHALGNHDLFRAIVPVQRQLAPS